MSHQAEEAVLKYSASRNAARLVLFVIAFHADRTGHNSYPSMQKLMKEAGCSERSVWSALKALVELGELHITGGKLVADIRHPYSLFIPQAGLEGQEAQEAIVDKAPQTVDNSEDYAQKSAKFAVAGEAVVVGITANIAVDECNICSDGVQILQYKSADFAVNECKLCTPTNMYINSPLTVLEESVNSPVNSSHAHTRGEAKERPPEIVTFPAFFDAVWSLYPKRGKVDRSDAMIAAQDIPPKDWPRVLKATEHYAQSSVVKRNFVRNAANFLRDECWIPYEDGPIIDEPQTRSLTVVEGGKRDAPQAARQRTAYEQKADEMDQVIESARRTREQIEHKRRDERPQLRAQAQMGRAFNGR